MPPLSCITTWQPFISFQLYCVLLTCRSCTCYSFHSPRSLSLHQLLSANHQLTTITFNLEFLALTCHHMILCQQRLKIQTFFVAPTQCSDTIWVGYSDTNNDIHNHEKLISNLDIDDVSCAHLQLISEISCSTKFKVLICPPDSLYVWIGADLRSSCKAVYRVICGMCQLASMLDMFGLVAHGFTLHTV